MPPPAQPTLHLDPAVQVLLLIAGIAMWVLFAWMVGSQARAKGYGFGRWFVLALIFSPFALSAALHLLPHAPTTRQN